MSTTVLGPPSATQARLQFDELPRSNRERLLSACFVVLLTLFALVIHGYHPYAEDGGLYAAGIKRLLNPALYPYSRDFVDAHLRYSVFAPGIASAVRLTRCGLSSVLLAVYLLSTGVTLGGILLLARRCYESTAAHLGATALMAAWLTLPVAGTSLILVDPYVTARSISLPCSVLALVAAIDFLQATTRRKKLVSAVCCAGVLLCALLIHPLMAAYAVGDVMLLTAILSGLQGVRRWGTTALCSLAFAAAGLVHMVAPMESPAYSQVAVTRLYWYLPRWQWYEIVGLVAPPFILLLSAVAVRRWRSGDDHGAVQSRMVRIALARMGLASGVTAILVTLVFAHEGASTHLVARLQPLRSFQTIYLLMIVVLGATLGDYVLRSRWWRWMVTLALLGGIMFGVQRSTFPASAHVEWPLARPENEWQRAFIWISENTPVDARFALDANYISQPGEDAQSFRAIAERSSLPDYSKDGGEASITPRLAPMWADGQLAQHQLSVETDEQRLARLRPFNVDWVVLQQHAQTGFICPYQNERVKVCRLP